MRWNIDRALDWLPCDKRAHIIAGTVVAAGFRHMGPGVGLLAALVAGIAKELYDARFGGDVSLGDIVATAAGGVLVELGALGLPQ